VGHVPEECPICSWAAVPPYNKAGYSPARPGRKPASSASALEQAAEDMEAEPTQGYRPSAKGGKRRKVPSDSHEQLAEQVPAEAVQSGNRRRTGKKSLT
jgi:hypothetical protein